MNKNDQMPAGGCENCGSYDGEEQSVLREKLIRDGDSWVCRPCYIQGKDVDTAEIIKAGNDLLERLDRMQADYEAYKAAGGKPIPFLENDPV